MVETRKWALVSGGSSEIGRAVAIMLAELGRAVILWGRDARQLARTASECRARGAQTEVESFDVNDPEALRAASERAMQRDLVTVVWAAGIFDWAPATDADPMTWSRVITTNLTSAAVATALLMPRLVETAPSEPIFVGSGAARAVFANNAAYVASKHGLAGLAGATFLDVRDQDVKVSLVSPGLVDAGSGRLSQAGQERPHELLDPEDVAAAVRFVVTFPTRGCPTEILLQPQRTP